jgi:outer membrane protein
MTFFVRSTLAMLVLAVAATGTVTAQQTPTIVFIDSERIGQQAVSLQAAQQRLEAAQDSLEQRAEMRLAPMQQEFQRQVEEFQQQQGMMTSERRQARQQELAQRQQDIRQAGAQFEREARMQEAEILGPVLEQINEVINQLRQERGYAFILNASAGGVISADPSLDITDEVLRRLNTQANRDS